MEPCGIAMSSSKYQQGDFTIPFLIQSVNMVVPWPKQFNQQFIATIYPFQPMVSCLLNITK